MPGVDQEYGGIIRHGAKMLFAYGAATVPKVTIILRKAYGGAYLAMCSKEMGADRVYAWPAAEIAVMGAEGAAAILYAKGAKSADDPQAFMAEKTEEYKETFTNPYVAAGRGYIDDVIDPAETKFVISNALETLRTKREMRPQKKHGLIPL
jgi:methylmalonyl-CoA carboxyltransferase large subunit